jgi:hypothetical protein
MKTNSKVIGGNYERDVAVRLSEWLTGSKENLVVWRDISSGTLSTVRKNKNLSTENQSGDFRFYDFTYKEFFHTFHVDAKSLGSVHLMLINPSNQKSSQLLNEWNKVKSDAGYKIPMMFVKARNDRKIPDFIIIPECIKFYYKNIIIYDINENNNVSLILQKEFFEMNDWKIFTENNKIII